MNLLCYTFLAMHAVAYDQLLPVYLNYPYKESTPENTKLPFRFTSGFGLTQDKIGAIFTLYGIICGVCFCLVISLAPAHLSRDDHIC